MAYYGKSARAPVVNERHAERDHARVPLASETHGERDQMSHLNDQLAEYIQNVREMRVSSARALGKAHYYESLERMENEILKMKAAYEEQMRRMRQDVNETNDRNIALTQALQRDRQTLQELQAKIVDNESTIKEARMHHVDLRQVLSQKQAEVFHVKDEAQSREEQVAATKVQNDLLSKTKDEILKKLDIEIKRRMESEARIGKLEEDRAFDANVHADKENELRQRLKQANNIIQSLDDKLKELSQMTHEQLPQMVKYIRDSTANELEAFHAETENRFGMTIASLKRQMDDEHRIKVKTEKEKEVLQKATFAHETTQKELQGQNQTLREQLQILRQELENETAKSQTKAMQQERVIENLNEELLDKAQEFVLAREAQSKLKAEIEAYKNLLTEESNRMKGNIPTGRENKTLAERYKVLTSPVSKPIKPSMMPVVPQGDPFRNGIQVIQSQPKLPPIQGQSNMTGILQDYKHQNMQNRQRKPPWSTYETTYGRSFTPKPYDKYGKPYGFSWR